MRLPIWQGVTKSACCLNHSPSLNWTKESSLLPFPCNRAGDNVNGKPRSASLDYQTACCQVALLSYRLHQTKKIGNLSSRKSVAPRSKWLHYLPILFLSE